MEIPTGDDFVTFLDAVPDAMIVVDASGSIVEFNRQAEQCLGFSREEAIGQPVEMLLPERFRKQHVHHRTTFMGEVEGPRYMDLGRDLVALCKDGSELPAEFTLSTLATKTGPMVIVALRDISQRREAERALRESEQYHRMLFEQSPMGMVLCRMNGDLVDINPSYADILGRTVDDTLQLSYWDITPKKYAENEKQQLEKLKQSGRYGPYEKEYIHKDGHLVPVRLHGLLLEKDGETYIWSSVEDISEQKQAEQALAKTVAEWNYALDFFEDAIHLVDLNDRVIRANRAFYELIGKKPEDVIGQDINHLLHPYGEDTPCQLCLARQDRRDAIVVMEGDDPCNVTGRPVEVTVRMIRNDDGELTGVLTGIHDLTRVRRTEDEIKRLHDRFDLLLGSTDDGILGVDKEGRCTFVNKAGAEMLGYQPADLEGQGIHDRIQHHHENGQAYEYESGPVARTIREGISHWVDDEVLWHKNGASIPVELSISPVEEGGAVTGAVVVFRNVSETRAMARKMDYLATHDTLTGLLNRHEFDSRLQTALDSTRQQHLSHILCYLDLDQFKVVNDTCGHVAGDELLRQLSTLLHARLRKADIFARLGGDEFGVLLEDCSLDEAARVVDALRETVQDFRFVWEERTFALSVSIGMVEINDQTESLATALSAADAACYMAKDSGRNRIHVYQADDAELALRHGEMQWVSRIHEALEQDRFTLRYQPIVLVTDDYQQEACYEILLSMKDTSGHVVPPGAFLPAAERFNLVSAIDRWVVINTFDWLEAHPGHLEQLGFCSINLSGNTLSDDEFLISLVKEVEHRSIPPEKICFEITETAAIANLNRATAFITELKRLGCRFALDDFGSGMSSFAYLKHLPVDYLKIDGNFVRDIVIDPIDRAMVEAINQVGHVMDIQTIAEHVEDADIMTVLAKIGVDYAQGYGIAEPRELMEFVTEK